jgi:hypothetical protein
VRAHSQGVVLPPVRHLRTIHAALRSLPRTAHGDGTGSTARVTDTEDSRSWRLLKVDPPIRHAFGSSRPFRSKPLGAGRWLIAGPTGRFAVEIGPALAEQPHIGPLPEPFVGPVTGVGMWDCPGEAQDEGGPTRSWLEATFGPACCRAVSVDMLPTGLTHDTTRDFLVSTGLPALYELLPFVRTVDLRTNSLEEVRWPENEKPPPSDGPFYVLPRTTAPDSSVTLAIGLRSSALFSVSTAGMGGEHRFRRGGRRSLGARV